MMLKTLAIARWEYIEKVKSKAFLISLFLMPIMMIGFGVLPTLFATSPDSEVTAIGVIDLSNQTIEPLARLLDERYQLPDGRPNYLLRPIESTNGNLLEAKQSAERLISENEIEGYLIIRKSDKTDSSIAEYRSQNIGNIRLIDRLNDVIRDVVVEKRLRARGLDPVLVKDLTEFASMKTFKLSETGPEEESGFGQIFFTAYIFMMMMFFLVITSGQLLVRSMLEEKSNRVVEVLLSSASAKELMAGKILGLSGLGFTQLAFWGLIGAALSLKFGVAFVPLSHAAILLLYFILGYLLYAALFVAAGAPVSTEQDAQHITSYLTIILVIPIALAIPVLADPNSLMVTILSYIPLLTPTMMALRIPVQMPSAFEIVTTLILLGASAAAMVWIAGKIFRTTILMYGKKPSLAELYRIIRYS